MEKVIKQPKNPLKSQYMGIFLLFFHCGVQVIQRMNYSRRQKQNRFLKVT